MCENMFVPATRSSTPMVTLFCLVEVELHRTTRIDSPTPRPPVADAAHHRCAHFAGVQCGAAAATPGEPPHVSGGRKWGAKLGGGTDDDSAAGDTESGGRFACPRHSSSFGVFGRFPGRRTS